MAEVAINYIQARLAQEQIGIARNTPDIQTENLNIAGWRVQAGLVSSLDEESARAQRAQTAASIPALESSYRGSLNRIAVLIGRSEEHTSELQSLMRISYAVFCLKKKKN